MSVCLMSSYWITSEGFRQGLLYLCIEELETNSRIQYEPLPFDLNKEELEPGCYPNRDVSYLKICTFFCLITQLSSLATATLSALGARMKGPKRDSCLKFSICTTLVTIICDTALLITYPMQFAQELNKSNRNLWELNHAYGLACGADILAMGALVLLLASIKRNVDIYEAAPARI